MNRQTSGEGARARRRFADAVGTGAAFTAAFAVFGAAPAWADPTPHIEPRPPIEEQAVAASGGEPASTQRSETPSPPVADVEHLDNDTEVAPLEETYSREFFAVAPEPLPASTVAKVRQIKDVRRVEVVDAAQVRVAGEPTSVLGVDPSTFRSFAPEPSATSDQIWQGIAEGHLALSHELGEERGLDVGSEVGVQGGSPKEMRVWTHATSGVSGIDALVSRGVAGELGFPEGNGIVVSAPDADLWDVRERLTEVLGEDAGVQLLAEQPQQPRPASEVGDPVPGDTVETMISAAKSRLGTPYVWGDEGPDSFDCSGLVQWAFARAGVSVPRVTHNQWNAGTRVEYSEAERGDLLFWRSDPTAPDYISHVAIYLGDARMIVAPGSGDVVKITDVHFTGFAGVVRVRAPG